MTETTVKPSGCNCGSHSPGGSSYSYNYKVYVGGNAYIFTLGKTQEVPEDVAEFLLTKTFYDRNGQQQYAFTKT